MDSSKEIKKGSWHVCQKFKKTNPSRNIHLGVLSSNCDKRPTRTEP